MSAVLRLRTATAMAAAFRDKYDFSDPKDYASLADMAYKASDALMVRFEADAAKEQADAEDKFALNAAKPQVKQEGKPNV